MFIGALERVSLKFGKTAEASIEAGMLEVWVEKMREQCDSGSKSPSAVSNLSLEQ